MHKDNPLVTHWREHHGGGEDPSFTMKIVKQHARPLSRQIHEGIQIANFKGQILINRKGEWGCNLPPTLVIEDQITIDAGTNENGANSQSTKRCQRESPLEEAPELDIPNKRCRRMDPDNGDPEPNKSSRKGKVPSKTRDTAEARKDRTKQNQRPPETRPDTAPDTATDPKTKRP